MQLYVIFANVLEYLIVRPEDFFQSTRKSTDWIPIRLPELMIRLLSIHKAGCAFRTLFAFVKQTNLVIYLSGRMFALVSGNVANEIGISSIYAKLPPCARNLLNLSVNPGGDLWDKTTPTSMCAGVRAKTSAKLPINYLNIHRQGIGSAKPTAE